MCRHTGEKLFHRYPAVAVLVLRFELLLKRSHTHNCYTKLRHESNRDGNGVFSSLPHMVDGEFLGQCDNCSAQAATKTPLTAQKLWIGTFSSSIISLMPASVTAAPGLWQRQRHFRLQTRSVLQCRI